MLRRNGTDAGKAALRACHVTFDAPQKHDTLRALRGCGGGAPADKAKPTTAG